MKKLAQKHSLILLAILIFSFAVRTLHLTERSIWYDEAFSWRLVQFPFAEFLTRAIADVHPILYYIVLKFWFAVLNIFQVNLDLFWLRLPSVILAVGSVFTTYLCASYLFKSRWIGIASALFLSASFFQIQYAWEARMYALGLLLLPLAILFFVKTIRARNSKAAWTFGILFGIVAGALLHTQYFLIFSVFSFAVFGLVYLLFKIKNFKEIISAVQTKAVFVGIILSGLIFLPWLPTFLAQSSKVQQGFWIPAMSFWSFPNAVHKILLGSIYEPPHWQAIVAVVVFAFVLLVPMFFGRKPADFLLVTLVAVPFLASWLLSTRSSIFLDRYFVFTAVPVFMLLARTISFWRVARTPIIAAIFIFLIFWLAFLFKQYNFPNHPGAIGASNYISEIAAEDEPILVNSNFIYFPMWFHLKTHFPKLYTGDGRNFSGDPIMTDADLINEKVFESGYKNILVVETSGFGAQKIEVPTSYRLASEKSFSELYNYQGEIIVSQYEL